MKNYATDAVSALYKQNIIFYKFEHRRNYQDTGII